MSSGPMMRQSALALVMATEPEQKLPQAVPSVRPQAGQESVFCGLLLGSQTLVWARDNRMSCHAGTSGGPLETMESWEEDTHCWHGIDWAYHCGCAERNSQCHNVLSTSLQPLLCPLQHVTWNVPKDREEATSLRSLICDLEDPCAAG